MAVPNRSCPPFLLFHGTDAEFDRFRIPNYDGSGPPDTGLGAFFDENIDEAVIGISRARSTRRQPWCYAVHLPPGLLFKHYDRMFHDSPLADPHEPGVCQTDIRLAGDAVKLRQKLQAEGYGGVVIGEYPRMFVIFDPDHIHIARKDPLELPPPAEDFIRHDATEYYDVKEPVSTPPPEARVGWKELLMRLFGRA